MGSDCDNLDAFLLGDLGDEEATRFERHVDTCAACREAVDQQRWLDGLLQSPERAELEPVPETVGHSIQATVDHRRRRRRLAVGGLAVAAALAVAAGWTVWAARPSPSPALKGRGNSEIAVRSEPSPSKSEQITKAVVVGDENTIVVPVESPYPNVTVVRVYRTYQPARVDNPDAGDAYPDNNVSAPDYSSGG